MICTNTACNDQTQEGQHRCPTCIYFGFNGKRLTAEEQKKAAEAYQAIQELAEDSGAKEIVHGQAETGINATLSERGERYGKFEEHARIAQDLQDVMRGVRGGAAWNNLAPDQKQALTVICDKIARMLNGDPDYRDNWHDIVGYAKLVDDRMARDEKHFMTGTGTKINKK